MAAPLLNFMPAMAYYKYIVYMIIIFIINNSLWSAYGLLLPAPPVALSGVIGLAILITLLVLKLKYGN